MPAKPYYENDLVKLYHANCLDHLADIQGGVIITDPPYNVGYHYDECEDSMDEETYYTMLSSIFDRPSVVIHYPEALFRVSQAMGVFPSRTVAWVYPSNTPRQHRMIAWFGCKPDFRKDGQDYRNPNDPRIAKRILEGKRARLYDWWEINQVKNVSSEKTEHPCQIPFALMKRIIRITETDLVIEPFTGSGTTLLAAQSLNRKAIGFEMSERYCEISAKRIDSAWRSSNTLQL